MRLSDQVLNQTELLAGELDEASRERLRLFCVAVTEILRCRLKVEPEEIPEIFVTAASLLAYSQWNQGEGISEFRAGDLTVKKGQAGSLEDQAMSLLKPYLKSNFAFLGV